MIRHALGIVIFIAAYAGIAIGSIPGLALDRTGVALLGAILMVVSGAVEMSGAVEAVDVPTLILLFGLMLLSAQLRLGGFYTLIALRASKGELAPRRFLLWVIGASAILSAVLSNDVVCLVLAPLVAEICLRRGMRPLPFLFALAAAANIGSAATVIGNPQNMFIGQKAQLPFAEFLWWCGPPTVLSLALLYGWALVRGIEGETTGRQITSLQEGGTFNRWQTTKGLVLAGVLVVLFFTPVPREISVLGVASVLLLSRRMTSAKFIGLVDWPLLLLFIGLFVLIEGFREAGGLAAIVGFLDARGVDLYAPVPFAAASVVLSNVVSNVPAVMLLMAGLPRSSSHLAYLLALTSTYAGNLILIGSIANLIVAEKAREHGLAFNFREHAKWTTPFAVASIGVAVGWWWIVESLR